jgi:hypothetical protein
MPQGNFRREKFPIAQEKMTMAVIIGDCGFFPDQLAKKAARDDPAKNLRVMTARSTPGCAPE